MNIQSHLHSSPICLQLNKAPKVWEQSHAMQIPIVFCLPNYRRVSKEFINNDSLHEFKTNTIVTALTSVKRHFADVD